MVPIKERDIQPHRSPSDLLLCPICTIIMLYRNPSQQWFESTRIPLRRWNPVKYQKKSRCGYFEIVVVTVAILAQGTNLGDAHCAALYLFAQVQLPPRSIRILHLDMTSAYYSVTLSLFCLSPLEHINIRNLVLFKKETLVCLITV